LHGYTTDPPKIVVPEENSGGFGSGMLIGVGAAVLILIILAAVVCKLKQQKKLQKDLEEAVDERLV